MTVSGVSIVQPSTGSLQPLGHDAVRLRGGFWGERQERNRTATIPHAEHWMSSLGWIDNFRMTAEQRPLRERRGREFTDTNVYNLLEALAWESAREQDPPVALAPLVDVVASAQQADGYLNTRYGRDGVASRYTDLQWGHELFNYGHLIQAGVAGFRTTGGGRLFDIAKRAADHVVTTFAGAANQGFCGHPGIEMALVELYRATGAEPYLEQAQQFVDRRGHGTFGGEFGAAYFQDDVPVRSASVLRGHAVRALYLSAGAVDVAVERGDRALLDVVAQQFERTVERRTYLTGGMGAHHQDEAFGDDFELPADRAYCETCAGIASVMLSWRLLLATGDVKYADLIERTLYNVVASCPDRSGTAFFYSNTLHQRSPGPTAGLPPGEPSVRASGSTRAPWFTVSCCPTNIARTFAALQMYMATGGEDGVQIHQYGSCEIDDGFHRVSITTDYPESGEVVVRVLRTCDEPWALSLRIPSWAGSAEIEVGETTQRHSPGYARLERTWAEGDTVRLTLPLEVRWAFPDPRIDAVRGTTAMERGPRVYCIESPGAALDLDAIAVSLSSHATVVQESGSIQLEGRRMTHRSTSWPYTGAPHAPSSSEAITLELVPYHDRGDRGPATMRVFLPVVEVDP